ncbi:hypothetical protein DSECCO2_457020 [anaerobic digester metagenome]
MQIGTVVVDVGRDGSVSIFNTNCCTEQVNATGEGIVIQHDVAILVQTNLCSNLTTSAIFVVVVELDNEFVTNGLVVNLT